MSNYRVENRESLLESGKSYYEAHKNQRQASNKQYKIDHETEVIEYQKKYNKNRYQTDPAFKLRTTLSTVIGTALRKNSGSKYGNSILEYIPYTIEKLKEHLENLFEPWMTWDNQGTYSPESWDDNNPNTWTWQLDHIIPQSDLPYALMTDDNFKKCWSLDNLRPYSAKQNHFDGVNRMRHMLKKDIT